jgi:hypothetical protein
MHAVPFGASLKLSITILDVLFNDRNKSIVTPTSLLSTVVRQRLILLFFSVFQLQSDTKKTLKSFQTV